MLDARCDLRSAAGDAATTYLPRSYQPDLAGTLGFSLGSPGPNGYRPVIALDPQSSLAAVRWAT